jgi:hypothetical protein
MSTLDQIIYRAPSGSRGIILQAAASLADPSSGGLWMRRLEPWLRAGGPLGRGYLSFGPESALIRWHDNTTSAIAWQFAHAVVGSSAVLAGRYALLVRELPARLPSLPPDDRPLQIVDTDSVQLSSSAVIEARSRSTDAIELLVPMLARVLAGEQRVTMPWTEWALPEAVVWGLVSLLDMLGDTRPVSYLTYAPGQAADIPGLYVSFRPGAAVLPPDPGFESVAIGLATSYADNPAGLRHALRQYGVPGETDHARRIARLLDMWGEPHQQARHEPPTAVTPANYQTVTTLPGSTLIVNGNLDGHRPAAAPNSANGSGPGGQQVTCPICLTPIEDWDAQPRWRWDQVQQAYTELTIPAGISGPLRVNLERESAKRCPNPLKSSPAEHYLPADYGSYGPPVVLGFVGLTRSGKSHLLAAMIGAMQTGLGQYRVDYRALDRSLHHQFVEDRVDPLLEKDKVLPETPGGILTFADAFLMTHKDSGQQRPLVLFDVAGEDLTGAGQAKKFLDIADGLFFIVDPTQTDSRRGGDKTFNNVLDLLKGTGRLPGQVSAAIVLNKGDLVRFEDPLTRWLRSGDGTLVAEEFLRESRDVYAYLHKGAASWTLPYEVCEKATLHVVSPAGGIGQHEGADDVFPRGVSPRRVLRPLVAMLAMTGVLTGPEAEKVGI